MNKKLYYSIATFMGTIVGAGFLGIPYVVMKSGFFIGFLEMFVISLGLSVFMIYLGKLVIRTKGIHQFTGYAEIYIGKFGKWLMFFAFAFSMYSTILAYIVGEGQSLSFLFFGNMNSQFIFGIGVWVVLSALTYFGLKALEEEELVGVGLVLVLVFSLIFAYSWRIDLNNLTTFYWTEFFTPIGVILFAFLGFSSVPLVKRITGDDEKLMTRSIIIAHAIVLVLYLVFTLIVIGFKGSATPEVATTSLGKVFVLLGILTMFNSYFGSSIILRDTWKFDWNLSNVFAWIVAVVPCLLLFLVTSYFNFNSFTGILNVGALISGAITGGLIIFMLIRSRKILFNLKAIKK